MSLCDRCQKLGRCCSGFPLSDGQFRPRRDELGDHYEDADAVRVWLRKLFVLDVLGNEITLPFEPMYLDSAGHYRFWCTMLKGGRCSIYSHRPKLCEMFQPLSDGLCWHHDESSAHLVEKKPMKERGTVLSFTMDTVERFAEIYCASQSPDPSRDPSSSETLPKL